MTEPRLNVLVAYPYATPQVVEQLRQCGPDLRFLLDSGAFTAWKAGKPIELDDYCRFLEALPVKPWRYFALDVIGDPHGTMRNYEAMLRRGFSPVPIFTRGEDPSVLEDYYKTSDVVGIGGLVGTANNRGFVHQRDPPAAQGLGADRRRGGASRPLCRGDHAGHGGAQPQRDHAEHRLGSGLHR